SANDPSVRAWRDDRQQLLRLAIAGLWENGRARPFTPLSDARHPVGAFRPGRARRDRDDARERRRTRPGAHVAARTWARADPRAVPPRAAAGERLQLRLPAGG